MALTNIDANIDLDVYDHDLTPTTIKSIALDSETRYVAATLLWERNPYSIPQTASVILTVLRPDNTGVQVTGTTYSYDADGNTMYGAYAELTQLAIEIKGTCQAQFKLTDGDQILRTEIFYIDNGMALDADISTWAETVDVITTAELLKAFPTDTASGSIASFTDGADNLPLKSLVVDIDPVQSGSGDPSPSNVRPISGWDSVTVTRTGRNLWNPNDVMSGFINSSTHTIQANSTAKLCYIKAKPNTQYTISKMAGVRFAVAYSDAKPTVNGTVRGEIVNDTATSLTITTDNTAQYLLAWCYLGSADAVTGEEMLASVQFELGPSATEYEPYNGNTYTISLSSAGTVYGGTLDVLSGVLTVTHGYIASYNGETLPSTWISDRNAYAEGTTPTTGAQVVYALATPTTVQLTAQEVSSLYGSNSFSADCGDTTVEYRADPTLYIAKKIAEAVSALS